MSKFQLLLRVRLISMDRIDCDCLIFADRWRKDHSETPPPYPIVRTALSTADSLLAASGEEGRSVPPSLGMNPPEDG